MVIKLNESIFPCGCIRYYQKMQKLTDYKLTILSLPIKREENKRGYSAQESRQILCASRAHISRWFISCQQSGATTSMVCVMKCVPKGMLNPISNAQTHEWVAQPTFTMTWYNIFIKNLQILHRSTNMRHANNISSKICEATRPCAVVHITEKSCNPLIAKSKRHFIY